MIPFLISALLSLIALLLLIIILSFFFFVIDLFLDLPYVATKREKVKTIIKLAQIKRNDLVIDLGSGDGRLLLACARTGARAVGYEINPFLVWLTRFKANLSCFPRGPTSKKNQNYQRSDLHVGSIIVRRQNLWRADLSGADVIFVYGLRKTMKKFEDFVFQKAKRRARIIVNTNPFPTKKPLKSENDVFLYEV